MNASISVIIPNYNGSSTIGNCLEALFSSCYENFEVIVVDDSSQDNSLEIIQKFPCKLIRLARHGGASKARNAGALHSSGTILFFTDSDCIVSETTLLEVNHSMEGLNGKTIIGGTYTKKARDDHFFSDFQSIFIHHAETRRPEFPDYIATHAMAIDAALFKESGGFKEDFLPILEDVEFSHRMRRAGLRLLMNRDIEVQHIFNFSLFTSMKNAMKKSMYWSLYSFFNRDLFADSGTASRGLKMNLAAWLVAIIMITLSAISKQSHYLHLAAVPMGFNVFLNRGLFRAFYDTRGFAFALPAFFYYTVLYPMAVGTGVAAGMIKLIRNFCRRLLSPNKRSLDSYIHGAGIAPTGKPLQGIKGEP